MHDAKTREILEIIDEAARESARRMRPLKAKIDDSLSLKLVHSLNCLVNYHATTLRTLRRIAAEPEAPAASRHSHSQGGDA